MWNWLWKNSRKCQDVTTPSLRNGTHFDITFQKRTVDKSIVIKFFYKVINLVEIFLNLGSLVPL